MFGTIPDSIPEKIQKIASYHFDSNISVYNDPARRLDILVFNKDQNDTKVIDHKIMCHHTSYEVHDYFKELSRLRRKVRTDQLTVNFRI